MKYRNSEGYADPTAGAALTRIEYEERLKRRQKKHCNASGKSTMSCLTASVPANMTDSILHSLA